MHNLIEFLENTCKINSDSPAIEAADSSLNFAELRRTSLQIAACIAEMRGSHCEKKMVAVYLPKGAKCLCAMLGALYSGNVYVPMDCRAPVNRTKLILEIVQPILIITDDKGKRTLSDAGIPKGLLANYDSILASAEPVSDDFVATTLSFMQDVDPAYLLFTSGSTGVPKGVVIPHRRVINYINWAREYYSVGGGEVIGNQAPFYFTVSAMDIYLSLATGSKLCIIPENLFSQPEKLLRFADEHEITLIFWVSSVYHHVAKSGALDKTKSNSLKHAWFVGEPMATPSLCYWMKHLPDAEFANLYGSTETDMTICYRVPKDLSPDESVPLGFPCANTEVILLKDDHTAAKSGEIGEICVRGSCLASGYYKDAEKTQTSFIQNPLHNDYPDIIYRTGDLGEIKDGLLVFHGRRDHQFKHLGYRIEAGETEAIAARFIGIKNVCVLYDGNKRQIVLFYEADVQIDELAYRRALMSDLPVYMVPTRLCGLMPCRSTRTAKKTEYCSKNNILKVGNSMTTEEKLQLIERVLQVEPDTLTEATALDGIPQWDSLSILNLQIELTAIRPDLSFDNLRECRTVGEICGLA